MEHCNNYTFGYNWLCLPVSFKTTVFVFVSVVYDALACVAALERGRRGPQTKRKREPLRRQDDDPIFRTD